MSKATVAGPDPVGHLAIVKFPKPDDTRDIAAGEILGMAVARAAGVTRAPICRRQIGR